jgi:alkanesulfonate monooxygenase SsuD/methylene tetrahydromethanopterin reductase-like flavin-dependent oxidoreductase (luciferase family)
MARFREATEIIHGMWTEDYPTFSGKYYAIDKPINEPKGVQRPHPPLWLAGSGEKVTLKLVAQWGDGCNIQTNDLQVLRHKLDVLREHCATFNRDFDELSRSVSINVHLIDSQATAEAETAVARKGEDFTSYTSHFKVFTAEQLIAYLESFLAEGINYFIFYLPRTGYDLSQMQKLAGQVIPHFRQS